MEGAVVAYHEDASTPPEVPQEPPDPRLCHGCAGQRAVRNGLHLAPVDVCNVVGVIRTDPLKMTRGTDPEDWTAVRSQPPSVASLPGYGVNVGNICRDQAAIASHDLEGLAEDDRCAISLAHGGCNWRS